MSPKKPGIDPDNLFTVSDLQGNNLLCQSYKDHLQANIVDEV